MDKYVLQGRLLSGEPAYIRILGTGDLSDEENTSYVTTGYCMLATTFHNQKSARDAWRTLGERKESAIEFKPVKL